MSGVFVCDKCGHCCQALNNSELYNDLNDGTGTCVYYDRVSHLCKIYYRRPEKCNVVAMYKYFKNDVSFEEYIQMNIDSCKKLKGE